MVHRGFQFAAMEVETLRDFYRINKPLWAKLETILALAKERGLHNLAHEDLLELGRLYRRVASHLAYARTNRLEPETINYLNNLVARAHTYVYLPPAGGLRRLGVFFSRTFPAVFQHRLVYILLASALMLASGLFGLYLQIRSPRIASSLLSGQAEALYERFAADEWFNDPLADRPAISAAIMANNIQVAVNAFAGGILLGLMTLIILYNNGFMLGVMSGYFSTHQHGLDFWATILPHGVIELTAICIAGGAGLLLASALVKPGEYRRRDALIIRGREAVYLFLGVLALLVLAGAIEGFISTIARLDNLPRLIIAAGTALLLFPYLFWPRAWNISAPRRDGLLALAGEEGLP